MKTTRLRLDILETRTVPASADILRVGDSIADLQIQSVYTSDGAIRVFDGPGAYDGSTPIYLVDGYFGNLAVNGLLRSSYPDKLAVAHDWLQWVFTNVNTAGVLARHWYTIDGLIPPTLPATSLPDAEDSMASTFAIVLDSYLQAGGSTSILDGVNRAKFTQMMTHLSSLRGTYGLTWVSALTTIMYTMDNTESEAGYRSAARVMARVNDPAQANAYHMAADEIRTALLTQSFNTNTGLFHVALFDDWDGTPGVQASDPAARWYADTMAQYWPTLFGTVDPASATSQASYNIMQAAQPNWATTQDQGVDTPSASLFALLTGHVSAALTAVNGTMARHFAGVNGTPIYPFTIGEAGWLLQTLTPYLAGADLTTNEDTPLNGTTTAYDLQNQALTFTVSVQPTHGMLSLNPNTGAYTYTPSANFNGDDAFTLVASDGANASFPATFTIQVLPVNDPPTFTKGADQTVNEDAGPQTVVGWATNLNANDVGQMVTLNVVGNTNPSLFSVAPTLSSSGTLTYTPAANANGTATISVQAHDNGGGTDTSATQTFTITVNPVADAPVAVDDYVRSPNPATSFTIQPLANDTDADGTGTLSVTTWSNPKKGQLTHASNVFTYTPKRGASGTDRFMYNVTDNAGGFASATVTIAFPERKPPKIVSVNLFNGTDPRAVLNLKGQTRAVLPWANLNRLQVTFNERVQVNAATLALVGLNTGTATPTFAGLDTTGQVATWTFATPLGMDRYTLRVLGGTDVNAVKDVWDTPQKATWTKNFAVLPGDFNGKGGVDRLDLAGIAGAYNVNPATRKAYADINGDGLVDLADLQIAIAYLGNRV